MDSDTPAADNAALTPAQRLRARLSDGKGRLFVIIAVLVIWVMDTLLSRHLTSSGIVQGQGAVIVDWLESASTVIFVVTSVLLIVAILKPLPHLLFKFAAIYLTFSAIQVVANVLTMVSTAHLREGYGLGSLWDVAAVYAMSVTVFTFIYVLFDVTTPGGAFVWPARDGEEPPTPNLWDYLFISLNVNSTYGPTSEAVMSRGVKLVMSGQVLLAILMLTVLISRAVAATS